MYNSSMFYLRSFQIKFNALQDIHPNLPLLGIDDVFPEEDQSEYMKSELSHEREDYELILSTVFQVNEDSDCLQSWSRSSDNTLWAVARVMYYPGADTVSNIRQQRFDELLKDVNDGKELRDTITLFYEDEEPSKESPYRIYLSGCDDSSYTKYVSEKHEAYALIDILLEKSPVDSYDFVKTFGFRFTN